MMYKKRIPQFVLNDINEIKKPKQNAPVFFII